jgi:GTPase SAR1 family protein
MTKREELKDIIKNDVLPEVEDCIDEIFELVASKKADETDKEELKELQEMQSEFKALLRDIDSDEFDDEEIDDILEEIKEMQKDAFVDEEE